ncbi:hypothetical protein SVAN01_07713 [Stagonosporopsis vannaccii]|nr:hypothetical protein SVAN01_07713 [Stagonosporopsis vannaccii]
MPTTVAAEAMRPDVSTARKLQMCWRGHGRGRLRGGPQSCVAAKPKAGLVQCRKGLAPDGKTGRGVKAQDRVPRRYVVHVPTGRKLLTLKVGGVIGGFLRFKRTAICMWWWLQRRKARKARRSLRGSAAAQLQGPARERKRDKQTVADTLEWVAGGSMGGVGTSSSVIAPARPGPGALPPACGYTVPRAISSTLPTIAVWRLMHGMPDWDDARTSSDHHQPAAFSCSTPSRQLAVQDVNVHRGTGTHESGDRTTQSQSTCTATRISRISSCGFTRLFESGSEYLLCDPTTGQQVGPGPPLPGSISSPVPLRATTVHLHETQLVE